MYRCIYVYAHNLTYGDSIMYDIYRDNGYINRRDYLKQLAADMDLDAGLVFNLADLLGPDEDFDGLVTSLEDYSLTLWDK